MSDPDQPPSAADAELGPLVSSGTARAAPQPASAVGPSAAPPQEPRRRGPLLAVGAAVAAGVIGVAIGQTMSRPPAPQAETAAQAERAPGDQGLQISVQTKTVDPAPAPPGLAPPMPTPVLEEPAQTVVGPAVLRTPAPSTPPASARAQATEPAPAVATAPAPAPSVRRYTSSGPVDPGCAFAAADPASGCSDETFIEADRALYDAYAAARNAGVPTRALRRDQQDWRDQGAEAAGRSRAALLDAYRDRTDAVWAMIDEWQGDDGGDRRLGRR